MNDRLLIFGIPDHCDEGQSRFVAGDEGEVPDLVRRTDQGQFGATQPDLAATRPGKGAGGGAAIGGIGLGPGQGGGMVRMVGG